MIYYFVFIIYLCDSHRSIVHLVECNLHETRTHECLNFRFFRSYQGMQEFQRRKTAYKEHWLNPYRGRGLFSSFYRKCTASSLLKGKLWLSDEPATRRQPTQRRKSVATILFYSAMFSTAFSKPNYIKTYTYLYVLKTEVQRS